MRRRQFIGGLAGAAAWSITARAQQTDRMRRIGVLMPLGADDPEGQARVAAFLNGLQQLGWANGGNVRVDIRWSAGDADEIRKNAAELVALTPDVILGGGGAVMGLLLQATRTIPIVFTQTPDPVGAGFVESVGRPGGNATGFTLFEFGISVKWLEILRELAPYVRRAAVLRDTAIPAGIGQLGALQGVAPSLGVELTQINVREGREIERAVTAFARQPNGSLVVLSGPSAIAHRDLIITLAARHQLPAIYPARYFVVGGGLISYGPDTIDPHHRAASYVDRILRGEKAADLPVQTPSKYQLAINLRTANSLGLAVPQELMSAADELIE